MIERAEKLTCNVGAGAVVHPVLQQPLLVGLLWFRVGVPARLGALRGAVLDRVVVELEALALWSQLPVLVTTSVRGWGTRGQRLELGSGRVVQHSCWVVWVTDFGVYWSRDRPY